MKAARLVPVCLISIWVAAVLQGALAPKVALFGFRPDFFLIVLTPLSLIVPRSWSTAGGFLCGWLQGAMAGANLAHYAVSRTVAGFAGASSRAIGFEINIAVVGVTAALMTLVAQTVFMFLAAPKGIAAFLGDTIGSAVYNGVLAIPTYLLLRRVLSYSRSGMKSIY